MSKIYHYTKLKTGIEIILPLLQLRTNYLSAMNDPKESSIWSFGGINIDYEKMYEDYNDVTHIFHQQKLGEEIKHKVQALCFVNTDKDRGYDNEMMWAHYGDNHQGLCLEIDTEKFIQENNHVDFFKFENIKYELTEKPQIRWNREFSKEENIKQMIEIYYESLFLSKSKYWERENEKRLLIISNNKTSLRIEHSLTAVYCGLFSNGIYESLIRNTIPQKVDFYRLYYQKNKINRNHIK